MNKIFKFTLSALFGISLMSCSADEFPTYDGDPYLQFNVESTGSKTVPSGAGSVQAVIDYGTYKPVTGTNQVKLVYDAAASTAVPGVDFTLVNNGISEITAGQSTGTFKVNVLESGATAIPKFAVFHLSSPTLPLADVNQTYTLAMSLKCSVNYFLGSTGVFNYTGWWNDPGQFLIEQGSAPNTLNVVDFLDTGVDLVVKYDDAGIVTFAEQSTGVDYQAGPNKYTIKMSQSGAVSTYDACSRKLTINAFWFVPNVGSFGEKTEVFQGN